MILVDTSILVDSLTGERPALPLLTRALDRGERLRICTIVLYEWLRGPRTSAEIADQEDLFPAGAVLPFGTEDAILSAQLYRSVRRARTREADIVIAACAIRNEARLWTLNLSHFADIPGLRLFDP